MQNFSSHNHQFRAPFVASFYHAKVKTLSKKFVRLRADFFWSSSFTFSIPMRSNNSESIYRCYIRSVRRFIKHISMWIAAPTWIKNLSITSIETFGIIRSFCFYHEVSFEKAIPSRARIKKFFVIRKCCYSCITLYLRTEKGFIKNNHNAKFRGIGEGITVWIFAWCLPNTLYGY